MNAKIKLLTLVGMMLIIVAADPSKWWEFAVLIAGMSILVVSEKE